MLSGISQTWSNSPEIKAALARDKEKTEGRLRSAMLGFVRGWYPQDKVVVDKGRGWTSNALLFKDLFPNGKIIVMVRDLRDVAASVEKQHQKFPVLDTMPQSSLYDRCSQMFSPEGMIGSCVLGVEDLLRREPSLKDTIVLVQFEQFVKSPSLVMERVYSEVEEPYFKHDFENVKSVSEDDGVYDAILLNKYPHVAEGEVKPVEGAWANYISNDIAQLIMNKFPGYNKAFGYA